MQQSSMGVYPACIYYVADCLHNSPVAQIGPCDNFMSLLSLSVMKSHRELSGSSTSSAARLDTIQTTLLSALYKEAHAMLQLHRGGMTPAISRAAAIACRVWSD